MNIVCQQAHSHVVFTLEQTITLSAVTAFLFPLLLIALRAIVFSSKLPCPFKTLCLNVLLLDAVLAVGTAIEPWLMYYTRYDRDVGDLGILLVNTAAMFITVERVLALKFPLRYIACSSNYKLTVCTTASVLVLEAIVYALVRILPCYTFRPEDPTKNCYVYHVNYILILQLALCTIASSCFVLVVLQMTKNKWKHTRRITRMGLPMTYASNATAAHVSAILFTIFPTMLFTSLFSILSVHRCILNNSAFLTWCSILSRIVLFTVHGIIFNVWFDEGRLHFLTLLSPLDSSFRARADEMRIHVYNIVTAHAFGDSSRPVSEGQRRSRNSAKNSEQENAQSYRAGNYMSRTRRSYGSEKFNDISSITEATTSV